MIFYSDTASPSGSTGTDETCGTSAQEDDYNYDRSRAIVTCSWVVEQPISHVGEDWSIEDLICFENARAAKAFLREGLFLVLNPPKEFMSIKDAYWQRDLRCDRHGIGLRNRIDA